MNEAEIVSLCVIVIGILFIVFFKKDNPPTVFEFWFFKITTESVGFGLVIIGLITFIYSFYRVGSLEKSYYIIGKVVDENNRPVHDAFVYLTYGPNDSLMSNIDKTRTSGEFHVSIKNNGELLSTIHWGIGKFKYDSLTVPTSEPHKEVLLRVDTSSRNKKIHLLVKSNLHFEINELLEKRLNLIISNSAIKFVNLSFYYPAEKLFHYEKKTLAEFYAGATVHFNVNNSCHFDIEKEAIPQIQTTDAYVVNAKLDNALNSIVRRHIVEVSNKIKLCLQNEH